jgi:hypothetical protein
MTMTIGIVSRQVEANVTAAAVTGALLASYHHHILSVDCKLERFLRYRFTKVDCTGQYMISSCNCYYAKANT